MAQPPMTYRWAAAAAALMLAASACSEPAAPSAADTATGTSDGFVLPEVAASADVKLALDGPVDAALDAGTDATADAKVDAIVDVTTDAKVDALPDVPADAKVDAIVDVTADAEVDAVPDVPADAKADAIVDVTADAEVDAAPDVPLDAKVDSGPDAAPDASPDIPADVPIAPDIPAETAQPIDVAPDVAPDTASPPPACSDAPKPAPVSGSPLPVQQPAGKVETIKANGFTDDFLLQGDGQLKVGVRREWGASIVFYGFNKAPGLNNTNVIDANDTGREVQIALYDPARAMQGCAWNASCQTNPAAICANSITYLGWNPVQGGNECNIGSPIESIDEESGVLQAVVRPNHWNPDWQAEQCVTTGCSDPVKKALLSDVRYTQRLRFVQNNVVEIEMQVDNLSDMAHAATLQEFPTLYAAFGSAGLPNLNVLLDSAGQQIAIDQPANDGFFVKNFSSPGGWATLQNATKDYGVALYYENRLASFQGWQKAGVFNNFRSQFSFGIPAKGTVRARAYLVLGSFATVKALIEGLDAKVPAFGALDSPVAEQQVGSSVKVAGWALDNGGVTKVQARLDGKVLAELPLSVPRPDVCTAWPGYAMCTGPVGFDQTVLLPASLGACGHLLEVVATDSHGNSRVIGSSRVFSGGSKPVEPPPPVDPAKHPLWRFAANSPGVTDHMVALQQGDPPGYTSEGLGFYLFDGPGSSAQPMVPVYQRYCSSCTDHMPTLDPTEGTPSYSGADVLGYCAQQPSAWAKTMLTRLYSAAGSDHFLTASAAEVSAAAAVGYVAEWSCWGP